MERKAFRYVRKSFISLGQNSKNRRQETSVMTVVIDDAVARRIIARIDDCDDAYHMIIQTHDVLHSVYDEWGATTVDDLDTATIALEDWFDDGHDGDSQHAVMMMCVQSLADVKNCGVIYDVRERSEITFALAQNEEERVRDDEEAVYFEIPPMTAVSPNPPGFTLTFDHSQSVPRSPFVNPSNTNPNFSLIQLFNEGTLVPNEGENTDG